MGSVRARYEISIPYGLIKSKVPADKTNRTHVYFNSLWFD